MQREGVDVRLVGTLHLAQRREGALGGSAASREERFEGAAVLDMGFPGGAQDR